jgi:hypothetical protein
MAGKKRVALIAKAVTGQVEKLLADIRDLILPARRAIGLTRESPDAVWDICRCAVA